jgi:hypothetical protein
MGSDDEGDRISAASSALCSRLSLRAGMEKYVFAADWMPWAPCPKYTVFRYISRIWFLVNRSSSS